MKWGVRRYQNEDGTLTPAGKIRYAKQQQKEAEEQAKKEAKEKAKQEYEDALSIIDQQLKRIPFSTAAASSLKYLSPKALLDNGFLAWPYKAELSKEVAELVLARKMFKIE